MCTGQARLLIDNTKNQMSKKFTCKLKVFAKLKVNILIYSK